MTETTVFYPFYDEAALRDGFAGQRMRVLPRPLVRAALTVDGTRELLVTDCGYFPNAGRHGRTRRRPIDQAVVLICVRGHGWCETPAGRFDVAPGEVVVFPPQTPHAYGANADDPWTLWWLHLAGSVVHPLISAAGMSSANPVRVPADPYRIAQLATEVVTMMEQDTTNASLLAASGAAWHLLTLLASGRARAAGSDQLVDRAVELLRQDLASRTSVAELASAVGLSPSHFAALFRRRTGVPVITYLSQIRMARARELLDTTAQSIASVAAAVGYDDSFYFARQFRRVHGLSPSAYRKQQKG